MSNAHSQRGPAPDAITDFYYFAPPGSGKQSYHMKVGLPKYQIRRNKIYVILDKIDERVRNQAPAQARQQAAILARAPIQFGAAPQAPGIPFGAPVRPPAPEPKIPQEEPEEEVNLREPQYMAQMQQPKKVQLPPLEELVEQCLAEGWLKQ